MDHDRAFQGRVDPVDGAPLSKVWRAALITESDLVAAHKDAARVIGAIALALAKRRYANSDPPKWIKSLRDVADRLERARQRSERSS